MPGRAHSTSWSTTPASWRLSSEPERKASRRHARSVFSGPRTPISIGFSEVLAPSDAHWGVGHGGKPDQQKFLHSRCQLLLLGSLFAAIALGLPQALVLSLRIAVGFSQHLA